MITFIDDFSCNEYIKFINDRLVYLVGYKGFLSQIRASNEEEKIKDMRSDREGFYFEMFDW